MDADLEKLEQAVLALLYLNTFDEKSRKLAWKALPWSVMDRLHQKGYISDPRQKTNRYGCQTREQNYQKSCSRSFLWSSSGQRYYAGRQESSSQGLVPKFPVTRRNIKGRPLWSRFECSLNRSRGGTPL